MGLCYGSGNGVEVDKKKAKHYYEFAAIGDWKCIKARSNIVGADEYRYRTGNYHSNT